MNANTQTNTTNAHAIDLPILAPVQPGIIAAQETTNEPQAAPAPAPVAAPRTLPTEPGILSANTYFWSSSGNAASRRRNEERHQAAVAAYFEALGFDTCRAGDYVIAEGHGLRVKFHYSESCANVYKSLEITRDTKKGTVRSNITALRKVAASLANAQ